MVHAGVSKRVVNNFWRDQPFDLAIESDEGNCRRTKPGPHAPRPLSGLIKCGVCGATMTIIARGRYGCSRRRGSGTCTNSRRIAAAELELRVAEQLITSTAECGDWLAFAEQITTKSNERKTVLSHHIAKNRRAITQLLKTIDRDTAALNSQLRIAELEYDTAIHEREFKSLNIPAGPVPVDMDGLGRSRRRRDRRTRRTLFCPGCVGTFGLLITPPSTKEQPK